MKVDCRSIRDVKVEEIPDFQVMLAGFPCQSFSVAGLRQGFDDQKGRGTLFFELIRIIKEKKPEIVFLENVKNLVGHDNGNTFKVIIEELEKAGYKNPKFKVLNAMEYGNIPQNRERVFTVSIRKDLGINYKFPKKQKLKIKLKDLLDENVDESFYLSDERIRKIAHWKSYQKPFEKVNGTESIVPTLTARGAGEEHSGMITFSERLKTTTNLQEECLNIRNATKKGYIEGKSGDGVYISNVKGKRGMVQSGMIQTIKTSPDVGVIVNG